MNPALDAYLLESALVLVLVIGLGWLVVYVSRRAGVGRSAAALEVLARLPLEPRRAVYVVRVLDQVLILGASDAGMAKLGELPESAVEQLREAPSPASWLGLLAARGIPFARSGRLGAALPPARGGRGGP